MSHLSTLLGVGQNFKPFERREISVLLSLPLYRFTTFSDSRKAFNLQLMLILLFFNPVHFENFVLLYK